jgi:hypothetical protein
MEGHQGQHHGSMHALGTNRRPFGQPVCVESASDCVVLVFVGNRFGCSPRPLLLDEVNHRHLLLPGFWPWQLHASPAQAGEMASPIATAGFLSASLNFWNFKKSV